MSDCEQAVQAYADCSVDDPSWLSMCGGMDVRTAGEWLDCVEAVEADQEIDRYGWDNASCLQVGGLTDVCGSWPCGGHDAEWEECP